MALQPKAKNKRAKKPHPKQKNKTHIVEPCNLGNERNIDVWVFSFSERAIMIQYEIFMEKEAYIA